MNIIKASLERPIAIVSVIIMTIILGIVALDRIPIQSEEVDELKVALESESMHNVANEAVDVLYVALGTIISIDNELAVSALNEVIEKNNNKTDKTHYLNPEGKVVKLPN